ncbi:phage tail assembly protein [Acinetobacter venetianus]|uniref:phage tail assembly protein n=1 Tax=Acinetobacter venetianus TaxID=52133 RepID=UPI00214F8851|nr:phage tail assembly protein [Acinetobacter venetianus]MCR4532455.1 phage tail assembly protein [Acinetobacter venetianus]
MFDEENQDTNPNEYPTPYDYTLIVPLVGASGESITTINLQEPVISEIEMMAENTKKFGSMKAFKNMLANHTKLDVGTINKMGARDLNGVQKYYDYFLEGPTNTK